MNGFLNTGQGGTAYLGVLDDGTVKGLAMSVYQVWTFTASARDRQCRFSLMSVTFQTVFSKMIRLLLASFPGRKPKNKNRGRAGNEARLLCE